MLRLHAAAARRPSSWRAWASLVPASERCAAAAQRATCSAAACDPAGEHAPAPAPGAAHPGAGQPGGGRSRRRPGWQRRRCWPRPWRRRVQRPSGGARGAAGRQGAAPGGGGARARWAAGCCQGGWDGGCRGRSAACRNRGRCFLGGGCRWYTICQPRRCEQQQPAGEVVRGCQRGREQHTPRAASSFLA
jgi:hypothetical protein